ncbi:hypothetical protein ACEWY4_007620 [Coilia grayii]|uniref:Uncharacterized protein n=1 Tax=Coilia grayii TaxID=363190 RepID=A0ABD1KGY6_9TELE
MEEDRRGDQTFDGPQPYNYEPKRRERRQGYGLGDRGRNDGQRREVELWSLNNMWRIGQNSWCSCGHCEAMPSAEESMCCRELEAYWSLVQQLVPFSNISCLTQHSGFDACCLNPFSLQVAYLAFRQEYGPLQASRLE